MEYPIIPTSMHLVVFLARTQAGRSALPYSTSPVLEGGKATYSQWWQSTANKHESCVDET